MSAALTAKQALLFLKKKQQKNVHLIKPAPAKPPMPLNTKSFLLLFYKKAVLSCPSFLAPAPR
jgi:hypothetical protein